MASHRNVSRRNEWLRTLPQFRNTEGLQTVGPDLKAEQIGLYH